MQHLVGITRGHAFHRMLSASDSQRQQCWHFPILATNNRCQWEQELSSRIQQGPELTARATLVQCGTHIVTFSAVSVLLLSDNGVDGDSCVVSARPAPVRAAS
jgi:hypothetical protein